MSKLLRLLMTKEQMSKSLFFSKSLIALLLTKTIVSPPPPEKYLFFDYTVVYCVNSVVFIKYSVENLYIKFQTGSTKK